jgi:hypothetical protein
MPASTEAEHLQMKSLEVFDRDGISIGHLNKKLDRLL